MPGLLWHLRSLEKPKAVGKHCDGMVPSRMIYNGGALGELQVGPFTILDQ